MLVALNAKNIRRPAFEAEKSEKPFTCPYCMGRVVLRKGKVREHHFAHKPNSDCIYGRGESQIHYRVKREIYLDLKKHPNCKKCEIERVLNGVRPDVSLVINSHYVAIEVQRSKISIDEINERFKKYTKLGIFLLWVLPVNAPNEFLHEREDEKVCRIKNWEEHIQNIQNERLYYWQSGACLAPYHLASFYTYKEESEWYTEYGELQTAGGNWEEKKTLKKPIKYQGSNLHIAEDFIPIIRRCSSRNEYKIIPNNLKIWVDIKKDWWQEYYKKLHERIKGFYTM